MFDKLKKAFSSIGIRNIGQKEISEKDIDGNLFDLQLALLESDVSQEVIDHLSEKLKKELIGIKFDKGHDNVENMIRIRLQTAIAEMFAKAEKVDLIRRIKSKIDSKMGPYVIVFLGINGTGKTTTVAKMAHLLRKNGMSVVMAAGDTHRAGAIEQITRHGEKLSLKVISQRYGADPSAVGRDAIDYSRKHHIDAVLIDTAGRMQTAKNLMDEISKIVRVVKPDMKLFVGDSLAGNDTINQSREFFQYTNFDGAILTKADADAKGGAAISIAHITSKPILYLGVGQTYDDIIPFDPDRFIESIFGDMPIMDINDITSATQTVPKTSDIEMQKPSAFSSMDTIDARTVSITEEERKGGEQKPISAATSSSLTDMPNLVDDQEHMSEIEPKIEEEIENYERPLGNGSSYQPTVVQDNPTDTEDQKTESTEKQKSKVKSRFGGLFSRMDRHKAKRSGIEDHDVTNYTEKNEKQIKVSDDKQSEKHREGSKKSRQNAKDDVVYLSDEDIEGLLK
ncbi:MAG TPA: signal recognition particle-docking protein FtsY [Nitrososphaeraceae archaeon]|nr:signal recognition particle-docking protein FtsY [Nitrososphaeraceae archaeon]